MINKEYETRLAGFLRSLETDDKKLLNDIEQSAGAKAIPIARRETVSFLQTMIEITKPGRILEVGTAVAYSTIFMALSAGTDARITTIEKNEKNYNTAIGNVKKAEEEGLIKEGQIELLFGDASYILPGLNDEFDMVFMDAAKAQYLIWLPEITRILSEGGILISDNVLQDGTILESRFSIERRDRTIHQRMRDYLYTLKHDDGFCTSILPVGDGVALSYRRRK